MYHFAILRRWVYLQSLIHLMNTCNILKSKTKVEVVQFAVWAFHLKSLQWAWSYKKEVFDL